MAKAPTRKHDSNANLGFEAKLWLTADKLRNNMDAAEYKHVVLGLIFLKFELLASSPPSPTPSPTGRGREDDLASTCGRGARGEGEQLRDRRGETLFIDARKLGILIDRVHRELTDSDLEAITSTYHAWRSALPSPTGRRVGDEGVPPKYEDVPGFCESATTAGIAAHSHVLTPGRYVGDEEVEDDGDPFEEKMPHLVAELHAQFAEVAKQLISPGRGRVRVSGEKPALPSKQTRGGWAMALNLRHT